MQPAGFSLWCCGDNRYLTRPRCGLAADAPQGAPVRQSRHPPFAFEGMSLRFCLLRVEEGSTVNISG